MSDKLTQIMEVAGQLDEIVVDEQDIIKKLVAVAGGHLTGRFSCTEDERPSWREFAIKIKIKGLHVLIGGTYIDKGRELGGHVQIWGVTCKTPYKGAEKVFKNHCVATGWKACRGHISLTELMDAVRIELESKKKLADKENRQKLRNELAGLGTGQ